MRRSMRDRIWAEEVIRRYIRRRDRVQQRERAWSDLEVAILPPLRWLADHPRLVWGYVIVLGILMVLSITLGWT